MAKQDRISFLDFKKRFSSEEACREYLYNKRWSKGFICPKCGHKICYAITTRHLCECTACHYQASVIVGTVMERTHLPLEKWFWGIYFVGIDKRSYSAMQLARELAISYSSAWHMLHRIRKAMKERDSRYLLSGIVELDDAYFGAPKKGGKRGRGTEKAKVMIGVSINEEGHPQYLKMEVVADLKEDTVMQFTQKHVKDGSTISSDAYRSYAGLQKRYVLKAKVFDPDRDAEHLIWLHTIISSAKAFIDGTFHGSGQKHMQNYLDEFCYRFNRRHFQDEIFSRILCSCLAAGPITLTELTR